MYIQGIKQSEDYEKLEKSIIILFTDYELEVLKDIEKYITQWNLKEKEYNQTVLTNVLEIYIIEIKKYKDNETKRKLDKWIKFLQNPGVIKMGENKSVDKAKKVLEEISQDERERYLAELREKYIMDQKAIEDAGYDKGEKNKAIEIAKKMKKRNITLEEICEITGLTKEEVQNL